MATASKGVVTWAELRAAGISHNEIAHRVKTGALIRVYRGVYRVGHRAPSAEANYLAAVKACGEFAYLYDRAAAYLQELTPLTRNPPTPEVMCPTERKIAGIETRRCRTIHPLDVAEYKGIPITTVPRTLLDLAATADDDELTRACHEAWIKHRTGLPHVQAVLDRHPNAKGAGMLRAVMSGEMPLNMSRMERVFSTRSMRRGSSVLPRSTAGLGARASTCAGPVGWSWNSTASPFTTRATRGSRTAFASVRREAAGRRSGATRGGTSTRVGSRCCAKCVPYLLGVDVLRG